MPFLKVRIERNGSPKRVEVRGVAVLGRDKAADVFLDDKQASRQHARVFSDGRQFYVEDLASRNGTLVNGGKIQGRFPIQDGDEIRIGSHYLVFEDERPVAAADRPPPTRRESPALLQAREAVSGVFASFFMLIISLLIFAATAIVSHELFYRLLSGE